MTYKFGLEVEGFYTDQQGNVLVPPSYLPRDGFPGLVELRAGPSNDLYQLYGELVGLMAMYHDKGHKLDFAHHTHKFTNEQLTAIRAINNTCKQPLQIRNIYGKTLKHTRAALASCQINISYLQRAEYRNGEGKLIPASYGIVDTYQTIKALDTEFKEEIRNSGRQPGFYAIKDDHMRLEYRSLPNFVVLLDGFCKRVLSCIK